MADTPAQLAFEAAENAVAFSRIVASKLSDVVKALKEGDEGRAFEGLNARMDDLDQFLTFLVLSSDMLEETNPATSTDLDGYRERMLNVLVDMGPALIEVRLDDVSIVLERTIVLFDEYKDRGDAVESALRVLMDLEGERNIGEVWLTS